MKPQGCVVGLAIFVLIGFGIFVPVCLFGIGLLGQVQFNAANAEFRQHGTVREAKVVGHAHREPQGRGLSTYLLAVELEGTGERRKGVEVDSHTYREIKQGDTVQVWVLGERTRLVRGDVRMPLFFWWVLVLVPFSIVGLALIVRASLRAPDSS